MTRREPTREDLILSNLRGDVAQRQNNFSDDHELPGSDCRGRGDQNGSDAVDYVAVHYRAWSFLSVEVLVLGKMIRTSSSDSISDYSTNKNQNCNHEVLTCIQKSVLFVVDVQLLMTN